MKIVGDYAWEQGRQRFGITADLDAFVRTKKVRFAVSLMRKVQTGVARRAAKIIVPSAYLKRIITAWGIPETKITVIYNAVPLEALGIVPEIVVKLSKPLVVSVGRLVPWKHIDGVIDAVAAIPDASLAIAGDGEVRAPLEQRAREKLPGRHVFLGALAHADTLALLKAADAFVLNSSYEGLSHVLIEALALGTPIIATDAGGNSEVVSNEETGLVIPFGDTGALQRGLERILSDASLRARLSARAQESAARFSRATMLDATATFLKAHMRTPEAV